MMAGWEFSPKEPVPDAPSPPFLQKGKTGIARLAARFPHASVVPICIRGARKFMEPGKARIRLFTPIEVEFGEPITFLKMDHLIGRV